MQNAKAKGALARGARTLLDEKYHRRLACAES